MPGVRARRRAERPAPRKTTKQTVAPIPQASVPWLARCSTTARSGVQSSVTVHKPHSRSLLVDAPPAQEVFVILRPVPEVSHWKHVGGVTRGLARGLEPVERL